MAGEVARCSVELEISDVLREACEPHVSSSRLSSLLQTILFSLGGAGTLRWYRGVGGRAAGVVKVLGVLLRGVSSGGRPR